VYALSTWLAAGLGPSKSVETATGVSVEAGELDGVLRKWCCILVANVGDADLPRGASTVARSAFADAPVAIVDGDTAAASLRDVVGKVGASVVIGFSCAVGGRATVCAACSGGCWLFSVGGGKEKVGVVACSVAFARITGVMDAAGVSALGVCCSF
jgi:hypothetical protein